jgi:hypothetical protein
LHIIGQYGWIVADVLFHGEMRSGIPLVVVTARAKMLEAAGSISVPLGYRRYCKIIVLPLAHRYRA